MPRKKSEAVPEGNGPIPMLGGITLENVRQAVSKMWGEILREHKEDLRSLDRCLAGLEQDVRQPRLAMEADGP